MFKETMSTENPEREPGQNKISRIVEEIRANLNRYVRPGRAIGAIATLAALELAGCPRQDVSPTPPPPTAIETTLPGTEKIPPLPETPLPETEEIEEQAPVAEKTTNPRILELEELLNQHFDAEKYKMRFEILQIKEIKSKGVMLIAYKTAGSLPSGELGMVVARISDRKTIIEKSVFLEDGPLKIDGLTPEELEWIQNIHGIGTEPPRIEIFEQEQR